MHVDWDPPHLSLEACYILHLYLFRAAIDKAKNETQIRKFLLSMQEHVACRI